LSLIQFTEWLVLQLKSATHTVRNTTANTWITWGLAMLVSTVVAYSFVEANWVPSLPGLIPLIVLSSFSALALSGTRKFVIMPHIIAHSLGILISCLFTAFTIGSTSFESQILSFTWRLDYWIVALVEGGASTDRLPFVALILYLIFSVSYVTTYIAIRYKSVYSIIPSGFVLIANLTYLPKDSGNWMYLYLIAAGALLSWLVFVGMYTRWTLEGSILSKGITRRFVVAGLSYSMFVVLVASFLPSIDGGPAVVGQTWNRVRAPISQLETNFTKIFASLPARRAMALYSFGSDLPFRGNISLTDDVVMHVDSKLPFYWRARTYDQYNSWGWSTSETVSESMGTLDPIMMEDNFNKCPECIHNVTFELKSPTKTLYNSGITLRTSLPGDITYLKKDKKLSQNFIKFESERTMQPGEKYTVQIYVPKFGPIESFGSKHSYPNDVANTYLDLPDDFPIALSDLTREITKGTNNNYQKAINIRDFLRNNLQYSQDIDAPPPGKDAVQHFIFDAKTGYSDYFGSSMAVMLRAAGIPSRLAVGYLNSEYDEKDDIYIVLESGAHAWPEAYFSNYGWIPFEPTPGRGVGIVGAPYSNFVEESASFNRMNLVDLAGFAFEDEDLLSSDLPVEEYAPQSVYDTIFDSFAQSSVIVGFSIIALLIIIILVTLIVIWRVVFSYPKSVESAYFKLIRLGRLAGIRLRSGETPIEYADRLTKVTTESLSIYANFIVRSYGETIYYRNSDEIKISSDDWSSLSKELLIEANKNFFRFLRVW